MKACAYYIYAIRTDEPLRLLRLPIRVFVLSFALFRISKSFFWLSTLLALEHGAIGKVMFFAVAEVEVIY